MDERHNVAVASLRDTDRWLRRVAVYAPILSFIIGWGSGVYTTLLMLKDHERRIGNLESWHRSHDIDDKEDHEKTAAILQRIIEFEAKVSQRLNIQR